MGPIETFHGWGGEEDDLQLHLDHIRIKDVDLPYYRIAEVAVADPEPDALVDVPRLIIRVGDGEEFVVPLPADQAERARSLIQVPDARREALLEGALRTPSPPEPERPPDPSPSLAAWPPATERSRSRGRRSGFLRRLVPARISRRLPGAAEWAFAGVLAIMGALAVAFLVLPRNAPTSIPAANITPRPSGTPHASAAPSPRPTRSRHATPSPSHVRHKHHRTHPKVAAPAPVTTTRAPQAAPVPPPAPVAAPPKPQPKPSPKPTKAPPPPPPSPKPSISTSAPAPSPSISIG